jgi:hypothetical protein
MNWERRGEEGGAGVGAAGKKMRQVQALKERNRGRCIQKEEGGLQNIGEVKGGVLPESGRESSRQETAFALGAPG